MQNIIFQMLRIEGDFKVVEEKIVKGEENLKDILRGCTLLGTGGGGPFREGVDYISEDIKEDRELKLIDPKDVDDETWTCSVYYAGTITHLIEIPEEKKKLPAKAVNKELIIATKELEKILGAPIKALVPLELGGGNTAAAMHAAMGLGIPLVDGDYAGRAIPELEMITPCLKGKPDVPIVTCNEFGEIVIIKESVNYTRTEVITRWLSVASFGKIGNAGYPMKGKDMKEVIVPNTVSKCLEIGKAIREAKEQGKDVVKVVLDITKGWLLFKGKVTKKTWESKGGFTYGETVLEGIDEFKGHEFKIWFKNENHITWKNGEPFVTSPDLISTLDLNKKEPVTNTDIAEGDVLAVIGIKAPDILRTKEALEILAPKHFGFDLEYVPIEEKIKEA